MIAGWGKIVEWTVLLGLGILSGLLITGRASWLIAGYNTSSEEQKKKYNEKKLCRVVGSGLAIITIYVGVGMLHDFKFYNLKLGNVMGYTPLIVIGGIIILANTWCKNK